MFITKPVLKEEEIYMEQTVVVSINIKGKTEKASIKFLDKNLKNIHIVESNKNAIIIEWKLAETQEIHDVEEELYYLLRDGSLGDYELIEG